MSSEKVGKGEIINVGTGTSYSVFEVASLIGGPTVFAPPRQGEVKETLADNSRARELLGWSPRVSFEDGIGELKRMYRLA